MAQKITIGVTGAQTAPYRNLVNLQGDLKILTEQSYQRFKKNILENGFIEPISVWIDENDGHKLKILNGHQRLATIKRLVENENFEIDELPINVVKADSLTDAKKKVLALTSEYGEMSNDGLVNFLLDMDMTSQDIQQYLTEAANLSRISVEDVIGRLGELKLDIDEVDPLDVGNMIVGDESAAPTGEPVSPAREGAKGEEKATVKNDPMTGLRLMQIFLTNEQLETVKGQIDRIIERYKLDNTTDAILKALEVVDGEITAKKAGKNENDSAPKTKTRKK